MPELETQDLVFRPYTPEDRPFIESSWASSYYSAQRIKDFLSPETFHFFHRPLRERFFNRPTATVIVVAAGENPDVILGWIAVECIPNATVIHYLYVKADYRRKFDLANQLLIRGVPAGNVLYTHFTPKAGKIMAANPGRFRRFKFSPHLT